MECTIAKWETWSKQPRKRKHKYNEGRYSLGRLVIPSSKDTLDIQLLVAEARKIFQSKGEQFFVGRFLAGLIREGVKSITKPDFRAATEMMIRMTYSPQESSTYFMRKFHSLRMKEEGPPPEESSVIPSIFSYHYTRIGGNDLLSAFLLGLISDEDVFLAYRSANEILNEIDAHLVLKQFITMNQGHRSEQPQATRKRKTKARSPFEKPIAIRKILNSPELWKYFTKQELDEYRKILEKADNPGETE